MSVPKSILIWLIVTKNWSAHQYKLFRSLFALSTLSGPKIKKKNKFSGPKIKIRYLEISSFYICVLKITWYLIRKIWCGQHYKSFWAICAFYHIFGPKSQNFWKKRKKTPGYIISLQLHPKNHNHLMYSSLKLMATALQVILGQLLPLYSIFGQKLKFSKKEKMPKTYQKY